jgi:hypothetical protein
MAKDAPRIEKPCRVCGEIMYCTPRREVCSKCRRIAERDAKRMRDKKAATVAPEKAERHQPCRF